MRVEPVLINELQLGDTLNRAIEFNRRGEFGLLLAMLSHDARDMAQFTLSQDMPLEAKLKLEFELPEPQPLTADLSSDYIVDNSRHFLADGARSFQLHQALVPEALVIRGSQNSDMSEVLGNTDLPTRLRSREARAEMPEALPLADILTMQRNFSRKLAGFSDQHLGEPEVAGI